jgi:hypothetical protein
MQEAIWVIGLLIAVGAYAASGVLPALQLVGLGQVVMLSAAAVGVPLELLYYALLAWTLHANGKAVRGWYWRSFEHHASLTRAQRPWVLTPFYLGALAFLTIALGIATVLLGFVALARQH